MARRNTYRTGFTAVELLIVLAIVALLGALAASAVFRVRASAEKTATEQTLTKLASALDVHWKAVIDAARREYDGLPTNIKQNLVALADNPKGAPGLPTPHPRRDDRARLLYIKFRLKQEFPTSFATALNPTCPDGVNFPAHLFLPAQPVLPSSPKPFTGKPAYVRAIAGKASPGLANESAALSALALQQSRSGVSGVAIDQLVGSNFLRTQGEFQYVVDSWGHPLQFYVFPTGAAAGASDLVAADPQDPENLLAPTPISRWSPQMLPRIPPAPWESFRSLLHQQVSGRRLVPTIASAGPDGILNNPLISTDVDFVTSGAANDPSMNLAGPGAFDNIYSFRLRQTGARGD